MIFKYQFNEGLQHKFQLNVQNTLNRRKSNKIVTNINYR